MRIKVLGTLAERHLVRATLRVEAREADGTTVRAHTDVVVTPGAEGASVAPFSYLLGDPPLSEVWWQLSTVDANGFPAAAPWGHGGSDLLVVDLRSSTVTG